MAMKINEDCISCGACVPECPTESITEGDTIYVINAATCVECEGHFETTVRDRMPSGVHRKGIIIPLPNPAFTTRAGLI